MSARNVATSIFEILRSNWPLFGALLATLVITGVAAAAPIVAAIIALHNGENSDYQTILVAVGALSTLSVVVAFNLGFRMIVLERYMRDGVQERKQSVEKFELICAQMQQRTEGVCTSLRSLADSVLQLEARKLFDRKPNCKETWRGMRNHIRMINPGLKSEVQFHVCSTGGFSAATDEDRLAVWVERSQARTPVDIVFAPSHTDQTRDAGIAYLDGNYPIQSIARLVLFLDRLEADERFDQSLVRVYFAEIVPASPQSLFLSNVVDSLGSTRPAVLSYVLPHHSAPYSNADWVDVSYHQEQIQSVEAEWRRLIDQRKPWSAAQVTAVFGPLVRKVSGELMDPLPREFSFDPNSPPPVPTVCGEVFGHPGDIFIPRDTPMKSTEALSGPAEHALTTSALRSLFSWNRKAHLRSNAK